MLRCANYYAICIQTGYRMDTALIIDLLNNYNIIYITFQNYILHYVQSIVLKRSGFEKTPTAYLPKINVKINRSDKKRTTTGRDSHSQQNSALSALIIKTRTRSAQPSTHIHGCTRLDKNLKLIYSRLLQTDLCCVIIASATRNP